MGFDVFLSYSRADRKSVLRLDNDLREQFLNPFFDEWYLTPGKTWQDELENHLTECKSVAVIIGPNGLGPWQHREIQVALARQVQEKKQGQHFPVIPVILPGTQDLSPGFLSQEMWIDFRKPAIWSDEIKTLIRAVNGNPRGAPGETDSIDPRNEVCPYGGLNVFREEDAPFYFGRDKQIKELIEKITQKDFIAVVGPSGSGKSSLVYSGLFPLLRKSYQETTWELLSLKPGKEPLKPLARLIPFQQGLDGAERKVKENVRIKNLANRGNTFGDWMDAILEDQKGTNRILLFVDQWEELYTEATRHVNEDKADYPDQVQIFIDQLLKASENGKLTVVMTMRGDFYGTAVEYPPLRNKLVDAVVPLGRLEEENIKDVIQKPAEKVALKFEAGLVERILKDLGSEPGRLPLLEFLLKRLWDLRSRHDNILLHDAYKEIGGIEKAIATQADATYLSLIKKNKAHEEKIRQIFIRLVNPGEGREDTRARIKIPRAQIDTDIATVIQAFSDDRLIISSGKDISQNTNDNGQNLEVAHEALIQNWDRLKKWVNGSREFLRTLQRVLVAKQEWEKDTKNPERLLSKGRPLEEAKELLEQGQMVEDVRNYIELSIEKVEKENKKFLLLLRSSIAVSIMFFVATIAAILAGWQAYEGQTEALIQKEENERQRKDTQLTQSRFLSDIAHEKTNNGDAITGGLIALEGLTDKQSADPAQKTRPFYYPAHVSLDQAMRTWLEKAVLKGHEGPVWSVVFSPDGQTLASASWDKTMGLWNVLLKQNLVNYAKTEVPRCLTPRQRKQFYLTQEPPRWCIIGYGPGIKSNDPKTWKPKWPYYTKAWKQWQLARDRREKLPLPGY